MKFKSLMVTAASILTVCGVISTTTASAAPSIPCKTAKLIVPWKAGGGTHVLFSIYEKTMAQRLASEILAAAKEEGAAVKKRVDTHKMAEANKAFSHFRF